MMKYLYKNNLYSVNELSDMSGINAATIRARLRGGYSVEQAVSDSPIHDSVIEFCEASYYHDWIGMSTTYLYEIYWNWSVSNGYTPLQIQGFSRQLFMLYPMLKVVPTRKSNTCSRIIRFK